MNNLQGSLSRHSCKNLEEILSNRDGFIYDRKEMRSAKKQKKRDAHLLVIFLFFSVDLVDRSLKILHLFIRSVERFILLGDFLKPPSPFARIPLQLFDLGFSLSYYVFDHLCSRKTFISHISNRFSFLSVK